MRGKRQTCRLWQHQKRMLLREAGIFVFPAISEIACCGGSLPVSKSMMPVTIYTTAFCPYCVRAKHLLQKRGVTQFHEVRIDENPEERTAMMERTGRRTVPQIFIGNHHVGGHDDLVALDQQGGLLPLLGGR